MRNIRSLLTVSKAALFLGVALLMLLGLFACTKSAKEVNQIIITHPYALTNTEPLPSDEGSQVSVNGQTGYLTTWRSNIDGNPGFYLVGWTLKATDKDIDVTFQDLEAIFGGAFKAVENELGQTDNLEVNKLLTEYFKDINASQDSTITLVAPSAASTLKPPNSKCAIYASLDNGQTWHCLCVACYRADLDIYTCEQVLAGCNRDPHHYPRPR